MKRLARAGLALAAALVLASVAEASSPASTTTPVLGQSALVSSVRGHVTIKRPGAAKFVALGSTAAAVPFGTTIDASRGTVQVTIATTAPGAPATALFYSGEFQITQAATGIAELTLNGPLQPCTPTAAKRTAGAVLARRVLRAAKKPVSPAKRPKTRSLWGDGGSGQFTTKGNYAAATVLGTFWLTTDSCTSTVVSVAEGTVSVANLITNTSTSVTTGQDLTVQSSGASTVGAFSGAAANGYAVTIAASSRAVKFGKRYSLTATGTAGGSGTAYIYENVGAPCSPTLAAEQTNTVAHQFGSKTISAPGPFSLTVPALAKHTGTKYYCAYLTNPAAYAQVTVKVSR
jgi:hypothetical protein